MIREARREGNKIFFRKKGTYGPVDESLVDMVLDLSTRRTTTKPPTRTR